MNPNLEKLGIARYFLSILFMLSLLPAMSGRAQSPNSLVGLTVYLVPNDAGDYTGKFGVSTFDAIGEGLATAGSYTYLRTTPTQGQAVLHTTSPPGEDGIDRITFTFITPTSGTFLDEYDYGDGDSGTATGTFSILAPAVTSVAATSVTTTGARLNASINPNGSVTTAQFEYGTNTGYGTTVTITLAPNNGSTAQNVGVTVSGLLPGTLYHFRAVGANSAVTVPGGDLTFTTLARPILATTLSGGILTLQWPDSASGFRLEQIPQFAPAASWTTVVGPLQTNNGTISAVLPANNLQMFYRLAKP
jgi:hypothetical protein